MTVAELIALSGAPDPAWEGAEMVDDICLAINPTPGTAADPNTYLVAQGQVSETNSTITSNTTTTTYIREGETTETTSVGRSFSVIGDRLIGNAFQDFLLDVDMLYAIGEAKVIEYCWFNINNGKGEIGKASLAVNSEGGGAAGAKSAFDITLNAIGKPQKYTYAAATP